MQVKDGVLGGACSTNEGEEERLEVIGGKARGKEATRKIKTEVGV
jgi:hypothetical protein